MIHEPHIILNATTNNRLTRLWLKESSASSSQPQGPCPQNGQQSSQARSQNGWIRFLSHTSSHNGSTRCSRTQGGCHPYDNVPRTGMRQASHQSGKGRGGQGSGQYLVMRHFFIGRQECQGGYNYRAPANSKESRQTPRGSSH
eukprot:scaffold591_cov176-Amphora_coffeaeformis.AAC.4